MEKDSQNNFTLFLEILAKIIAVVMIIRYVLLIVHTYHPFLPSGTIMDILSYIDIYAPIILMVVVSLSVVWNKGELARFLAIVICTAIIIFSFFPAVRLTIEQFTGLTNIRK